MTPLKETSNISCHFSRRLEQARKSFFSYSIRLGQLFARNQFPRDLLENPGANVMIKIFCDFRQFWATKNGVFLENQRCGHF
jgi:hypothetical protein